jgi:hypothetical protein
LTDLIEGDELMLKAVECARAEVREVQNAALKLATVMREFRREAELIAAQMSELEQAGAARKGSNAL